MMITPRDADRKGLRARVRAPREAQRQLLEAVVFAAERFLRSADWRTDLPMVLARLGEAARVSRVHVHENHVDENGRRLTTQRFEWVAPGCEKVMDPALLQDFSLRDSGLGRWEDLLSTGGIVEGCVADLPAVERKLVTAQQIRSLAVVPIFVEDRWWGFIGFDDCSHDRTWSAATLAVLKTAAGLFGAAVERAEAQARLEESENRFHLMAEATLEGILIHDGNVVLDANPSVLAMLGCGAEEVIGHSPFDFLSPESRVLAVEQARSGDPEPFEVVGLRRDGTHFHAELKSGSIFYGNRRARFVSVRDLSHRKRAEENERQLQQEQAARAAAEAAQARALFLAEASRVLSSSFDYETTLERVARLAVPYLADYCAIDMSDGERLRRVTTAAADTTQESLLQRLKAYVPELTWTENPIVSVLQRGESLLLKDASALAPEAVARSPEQRVLFRRLAARSAMLVPIKGSARVVGVISLVATDSDRQYSDDDLALAENLADRTGLAVQNARLFHEAQQASRARDEVLSVVAHDLRNPLGVIRNGAELLSDLGLDDRQRRYTQMILRAADGMSRLINDLLEITRIETGHLSLQLAPISIGWLAEEAASMLRPLAEARQVSLELEIERPDVVLEVDSVRIHQVISNLVGNALKFTPPGGRVSLGCNLIEDEARFAVIDTGPGIPPEEIPHVFGRFWQGGRNDSRGVGLGLAIAKGLIEGHRGRIWVESTVGDGARFYFTIPLTTADSAARRGAS